MLTSMQALGTLPLGDRPQRMLVIRIGTIEFGGTPGRPDALQGTWSGATGAVR